MQICIKRLCIIHSMFQFIYRQTYPLTGGDVFSPHNPAMLMHSFSQKNTAESLYTTLPYRNPLYNWLVGLQLKGNS